MADATTTPDVNATLAASVDALLDVAADLQEEKAELQKVISSNRDMLRGFVTQGIASDEQRTKIEEFYPKRADNKTEDAGDSKPAAAGNKPADK